MPGDDVAAMAWRKHTQPLRAPPGLSLRAHTPRAGRTDKSGTWTSKCVGKYLEGGKEAGGMLVDQRFCPRIVEGELRYNCVGPKLVSVCWRAAT